MENTTPEDLALFEQLKAEKLEARIKEIAAGINRLELERSTPPTAPAPTAPAAPPERKRDSAGRLVFTVGELERNEIPADLRRAGNYAVTDIEEAQPVASDGLPEFSIEDFEQNRIPLELRKSARYRIKAE